MAKTKMVQIEHVDSLHKEDITEAEYNDLQPRIQVKYKVLKRYESAETPAEVAKEK